MKRQLPVPEGLESNSLGSTAVQVAVTVQQYAGFWTLNSLSCKQVLLPSHPLNWLLQTLPNFIVRTPMIVDTENQFSKVPSLKKQTRKMPYLQWQYSLTEDYRTTERTQVWCTAALWWPSTRKAHKFHKVEPNFQISQVIPVTQRQGLREVFYQGLQSFFWVPFGVQSFFRSRSLLN